MGAYLCKLLYRTGRVEKRIVAEDELNRLKAARDPVIISCSPIPEFLRKAISAVERVSTLARARLVKTSELIDFSKNLSTTLRAGISVLEGMEDYASITTNRFFKKVIEDIISSVRRGSRLSDALEKHSEVFPPIFISIVRIGEETGRLDRSFNDIAEHLTRVESLKSSIKRALMYPAFVLLASIGALAFWLLYVFPKVANLFRSMHVNLPTITVAVLWVSDFLKNHIFSILIGFLIFFTVFYILKKRSESVRYMVDRAKLLTPVVKLVIYNGQLALISEYMRLLVSSGATIDRTLTLVEELSENMVFKRAISRIKNRVTLGESLSSAFSREQVFPRFLVRMIKAGEESGLLDEQLAFAANHYYERLEDITQKIGKMVEPIMLVMVGAIFAIIMMALFLPIYDLLGKIVR